jgi:hypothetical protein
MSITADDLKAELANHYGTQEWFKHSLTPMTYTEGVQAFAVKAGAYWLLDKIGLEIYHAYAGKVPFITITLTVKNSRAVLSAGDGNDNEFYNKAIMFTDCPAGEWNFFLSNDVLMLPSEY